MQKRSVVIDEDISQKDNNVAYYKFADFLLDISKNTLYKNGEFIQLTQKSFELLHFLVQNQGKIISKEQFFENVWSENYVDETNLTQHIYRIRKAIEDKNSQVYIKTIPKRGYQFIGKVESFSEDIDTIDNDFAQNKVKLNKITDKKVTYPLPEDISTINTEIALQAENESKGVIQDNRISNKTSSPFASFNNKYYLIGAFIILLCITASTLYFYKNSTNPNYIKYNQSVAVLPFKVIGEQKDEKLTLGMADSIISKLGNLDGIAVRPLESVISYSKQASEQIDQDLFEIGEKLGVDILLTGTIQKEKDIVRFNLKLYHVKNKRHLCAIKYDEVNVGTFKLQDTIANQVLQKFVIDLKAHADADKKINKNS